MCGIALSFSKGVHREDQFISYMMHKIEHRGYDQALIKNYSKCTVGFNRLAITERYHDQPGKTPLWEVYLNGEIYNYTELGFVGGECEVLAQGFEKEGPEFVKKLNGMFFIVAINGDDVYVFRDRYGIKPIYYFETDKKIFVASEAKAIWAHPDYKFAVNESAQRQWFVFNNVFTEETLFKGIFKFPKGSYWHLNSNEKTKYWTWRFNPQHMDELQATEKLLFLVQQAIKRQTPAEVSVGTCLSGGVDSGIIHALMLDIPSFTVGYKGIDDEREFAESMGTQHYQIVYDRVRNLSETIYHLEDPRLGASWPNYGLCKLASGFVKVLFDGAGADELFGGYSWRYSKDDYYDVVNRTGKQDSYCHALFDVIYPVDTLENRFAFDAEHFLEGVLLVADKMSMAHTIEMRVPFLDNDLVDFALTLPNRLKKDKYILKQAFEGILPDHIIMGKKKGFTSPDWFPGSQNQANKWAHYAFENWEKQFTK